MVNVNSLEVTAAILVAKRIATLESGQLILDLFLKHYPGHVPERYGDSELHKRRFDRDRAHDAILNSWGNRRFIIERSSPAVTMQVLFSPVTARVPQHSSISLIRIQLDRHDGLVRTWAFLREVASVLDADYAIAHVLTRSELEDRLKAIQQRTAVWPQPSGEQTVNRLRMRIDREGFHAVLSSMKLDYFTPGLKKCLPQLSWATIFGAPYVRMFGRERLLSAPAHEVEELACGAIALKLTASLDDTDEEWQCFKIVRTLCQMHLGDDFFCDSNNPPSHIYRVPQFTFPSDDRDSGPGPLQ